MARGITFKNDLSQTTSFDLEGNMQKVLKEIALVDKCMWPRWKFPLLSNHALLTLLKGVNS